MPNIIRNRLKIEGPENKAQEILEFLRSKTEKSILVDFNNIIKMPRELKITSNFSTSLLQPTKTLEEIKTTLSGRGDFFADPETRKNFLAAFWNYLTIGHPTWYEWALANWGVKWNAFNTWSKVENILDFETAWNGVPSLIEKISTKFPDVTLIYIYASQDAGCTVGAFTFNSDDPLDFFSGGEIDKGSEKAYQIHSLLWPEHEE